MVTRALCAAVFAVFSLGTLVASGAPETATAVSKSSLSKCFPDYFMFGSATAAYQVEGAVKEGGRTPSIWDDYCREQPGVMCANVADDFYHRYKSDVQLMKETGLQSFRFSISWSRAMNWDPETRRMRPNPEGIAFYHSLIDEMLQSNIQPILTLYHWDLPSELHKQLVPPGWLNMELVDHFVEYATLMFHEFGSKVQFWSTFNEPLSFILGGYGKGFNAPGFSGSPTYEYTVSHTVLVAHGKAVKIFRELRDQGSVVRSDARISIVLVTNFYYPLNASNPRDVAATEVAKQFDMGWFFLPLVSGDYPTVMRERAGDRLPVFTEEEVALVKGSYDLFMVNHYYSRAVTTCDAPESKSPCGSLFPGWDADRALDDTHIMPGTIRGKTDRTGNNYCEHFTGYAPGYLDMMRWVHAYDPSVDILLTENGWCGNGDIDDPGQLIYYKAFLAQTYTAVVDEKLPVIGYTAWSLLDNFEWGSFGPRFGLFFVNFSSRAGSRDYYEPKPTDLARVPRLGAKWYQKLATTKCLEGWEYDEEAFVASNTEADAIVQEIGAEASLEVESRSSIPYYATCWLLSMVMVGCAMVAQRMRYQRLLRSMERMPLLQ